jgi:hypothetical protein
MRHFETTSNILKSTEQFKLLFFKDKHSTENIEEEKALSK